MLNIQKRISILCYCSLWIRHFIIYLSSSLSREYSQIAFEKRKTLKKVSFSSFYFLLKVVIVLKTAYHQQCNRNGNKMKIPNEFELEGCSLHNRKWILIWVLNLYFVIHLLHSLYFFHIQKLRRNTKVGTK